MLDGSGSMDNVGIFNYTWTVIFNNGTPETRHGPVMTYVFTKGGVYMATLTVTDSSGNLGNDTVIFTVVDTGRVRGLVILKEGGPTNGAKIDIVASNGLTYSAEADMNGFFSLIVYHGPFTWRVSKDGYRTISGSGSVGPMNETELDLTDHPLVRETMDEPPMLLFVMPVVIALVAVIAVVLSKKKKRPRKEPEK
jgi:PKD repeat protein